MLGKGGDVPTRALGCVTQQSSKKLFGAGARVVRVERPGARADLRERIAVLGPEAAVQRPKRLGQPRRVAQQRQVGIVVLLARQRAKKVAQCRVRQAALHHIGPVEAVKAVHAEHTRLRHDVLNVVGVVLRHRVPIVLPLRLHIVEPVELGARAIQSARGLGDGVKVEVVVPQRLLIAVQRQMRQHRINVLHVSLAQHRLGVARAQQVERKYPLVLVQQALHVLLKRQLRRGAHARNLDTRIKRLQALLLPKQGHGATHLHKTHYVLPKRQHRLGLGEIGRIALVVDPARIEARASPPRTQPADHRECALVAPLGAEGERRHANVPLDYQHQQRRAVELSTLRWVETCAELQDGLHHVRVPRKLRRKLLVHVAVQLDASEAAGQVERTALGKEEGARVHVFANGCTRILGGSTRRGAPPVFLRVDAVLKLLVAHGPVDAEEGHPPHAPNPLVRMQRAHTLSVRDACEVGIGPHLEQAKDAQQRHRRRRKPLHVRPHQIGRMQHRQRASPRRRTERQHDIRRLHAALRLVARHQQGALLRRGLRQPDLHGGTWWRDPATSTRACRLRTGPPRWRVVPAHDECTRVPGPCAHASVGVSCTEQPCLWYVSLTDPSATPARTRQL